jgi:hypothetical protein
MKTPLLRHALGVALSLVAIGAAGAQRVPADIPAVPALKPEFERAEKLGLPTEPLIATARFGYQVSIPTSKIREAVKGQTDRMVIAREALAPVQSDAELTAGAEALRQKIPAKVLKSMRAANPSRSLAVPIGVLHDLVLRGVPVPQATTTVEALLKRNHNDVQIAALNQEVHALVASSGLAPSAAIEALSRGVLSLPQSAGVGAVVAPQTVKPPGGR